MEDLAIKGVRVTETSVFDTGGRITKVTRVTMYVGTHGPFSKDFYPPENTLDNISAWKLQQQQYVQSITS